MKNGLLVCTGVGPRKNIGDYIQSLATQQFLDRVDCYIEREKMKDYRSEEQTKLILNGWFMHNPTQFPPSSDIKPLITSFHIVPRSADQMLTAEGVEYFKAHQPIGCRDYGTMELLRSYNIEAYYSSCLTLTLGLKYMAKSRGEQIVFVDPYFEYIKNWNRKVSLSIICRTLFSWLRRIRSVSKLSRRFDFESNSSQDQGIRGWFARHFGSAAFLESYLSMFSLEELLGAKYLCHEVSQSKYNGKANKFRCAEELVRCYASARLVVTSRIHCALPCLALETPVVFVNSDNLSSKRTLRSPGRFEGVLDLMRVAWYSSFKLSSEDSVVNESSRIGWSKSDLSDFNKRDFESYRDALIEQCREFVADDK